MRPWALLLTAGVTLLVFAGAVVAQTDGGSPVLASRLDVTMAVDIGKLSVTVPGSQFQSFDLPGVPGVGNDCASGGRVDLFANQSAFRFSESGSQAGCATVLTSLALPAGAGTFLLSFTQTRDVIRPLNAGANVGNQQQFVRILGDNDTVVREFTTFDQTAGPQGDPQPFTVLVQVPAGATSLRLAWWFYDVGASANNDAIPFPGTSFASTVRDPVLTFAPRPMASAYQKGSTMAVGGVNETRGNLSLVVPADILVPGAAGFLTVELAATHDVTAVTGPAGPLNPSLVVEAVQGALRTVRIGPLNDTQAGVYRLETVVTTPLPPASPPPPPQRIDGLAYTALLLPLAFAVVATIQTHRYRVGSALSQRLAVVTLASLLTLAGIAYVLLVAWLVLRQTFELMAVLPIVSSGWRSYLGLGAIVFAYLLCAIVATVEHRRAQDLRHALVLERSNRDLEAFASAASHDLQEPLRDMQNSLLLLDEKYGRRVPLDGRALLHDAERGAERMRDLVRGVLDFARADAVQMNPVRLAGIVASARELVRTRLGDAKAKVAIEPLPIVLGDPSSLVRLFENLLTNAVKFGKPPTRIRIRAVPQGRLWRIEVADNGVGVPVEHRERIFRLFERLHGREVPGAGLGLAICSRIVERHGGTIGVEDTPGGGATFFFTLPAAKAR